MLFSSQANAVEAARAWALERGAARALVTQFLKGANDGISEFHAIKQVDNHLPFSDRKGASLL